MTAPLGNLPARLDLRLQQGSTFGPLVISVQQPDGSAADLTDCAAAAQLRRAASAALAAAFTCVVAPAGSVTLSLDPATTAGLSAGASPADPQGRYVWDLDLTWADGRVDTLLAGEAFVAAEITRAEPAPEPTP